MRATERLAQFIVETGYEDMPPAAIQAAKRAMLDTLGVMVAGSQEPAGRIITSFVSSLGGKPRAGVVGAGFRTSQPDAALANGIMGHALDYDDFSWWANEGHPSVTLLPCVLASGEDLEAPGERLIEAFILGFEVIGRLAISGINPRAMGFHSTAIFGTMGAAAAAAKLAGLGVEQTRMALGLAASHTSGIGINRGTMTKPYHAGNAARSGVMAALLVREGFTAGTNLIEGTKGFSDAFAGATEWDESKITNNLGNSYFISSPGVTVKKYPTCYFTHRCIDAMLQLSGTYQISADDVAEVDCQIGTLASNLLTYNDPVTYLEGKFSLPFCVAIALLEQKVGLAQVTNEKVNDPRTKQLMKRVRGCPTDEPMSSADVVKVRLKNSQEYSLSIEKPRGDPDLPLTDEMLIAKFRDCVAILLPEDEVEQVLELMLNLEQLQQASQLMDIISQNKSLIHSPRTS